ncbi:DoxX family protein [Dactylococcopsis salina]|uniref:Membrane protein n=1 Tax=Dactylococcopsis salina (strain PCC 8305) TaxID=13035 RepID=K9YYX0_DACS8|nr:DoxX family protein [Dactylococcopsis salina]AFZ51520.1 putative membrane protein [Dactylococcopsis salina PCC 8305]
MSYLPLFGRICLCLIFFQGAFGNFSDFSATQARMGEMGLPLPALLLAGNIIFQFVGAISLLLGFKVQWGAVILIVFLIPTTLIFHDFWVDPGERIAFFKNLALIGGLLLLIQTGAGAVSLDSE